MRRTYIVLSIILSALIAKVAPSLAFNSEESFDVCVSVRNHNVAKQNSTHQQASRPGKMGPKGPRGSKGDVGPPGSCVCDQKKQQKMKSKIDRLEGLLADMKPASIYFKYLENPDGCSIGLKNGRLPNSALTASSIANPVSNHPSWGARLDNQRNNQDVWVAGGRQRGEWDQVDLGSPTKITGIITQGRRQFSQWITSFRISFGNNTNSLRFIQNEQGGDKIFAGNHDRNSHKTNAFVPAITARYFRIYVASYHGYASVRMEYLKC